MGRDAFRLIHPRAAARVPQEIGAASQLFMATPTRWFNA